MGNIEESLEKKRKLLKVRISADGMQAFITLPRLDNNGERAVYSVQDIMQALKEHGVIYGIDQDMVLKLAQDPIPGREVVVATGKPFRDGLPGEFEYRFQRNLNRKPVEMPDGCRFFFHPVLMVCTAWFYPQDRRTYPFPQIINRRGCAFLCGGPFLHPRLLPDRGEGAKTYAQLRKRPRASTALPR